MPSVYLKPNVIVEPLFNQWYAWSYLIPPTTAALYIANSHLPILESFVANPQVHATALRNPSMRGGPFIHHDASRVAEIRALLEQTRLKQAPLLKLAEAIQTLDSLLLKEANGYSLEPFYERVPELLKGYVELVYDANNQPAIRLIERLLYSQLYDATAQSVALYLGNEDKRSFVLSTPRLKDSTSLHLEIPFNDPRLDHLWQMRDMPHVYAEIVEQLAVKDTSLFSSFFTETPPKREPQYSGDAVRIRYFGHACVLIETQSVSILCDPLISYQYQAGMTRYTYTDLPEVIDYVLITHHHQDHVMLETLLQLRHKIRHLIVPKSNKGSLIDPSLKLILQTIGFANVQEIDELEILNLTEGYIASLPVLGEHGDLNIGTKTAYLIQLQGQAILCAADSNNIEPQLYRHLRDQFGKIDVIFIGMECEGAPYTWAYGPLLTQPPARKAAQTRRLDGSNAARAIDLINQFEPQQVYVYAMGQEPWLTHITSIEYTSTSRPILESNQLIDYCQQNGIQAERLLGRKEIFLEPGSHRSTVSSSSLDSKQQSQSSSDKTAANPLPIQEWLADLAQQDIKFTVESGNGNETARLKCNAPKGVLTPILQTQLKTRKAEIIQFLTEQPAISKINLAAEAILDPEIRPQSALPRLMQSDRIFLTGATGFLGAFLLNDLLQQTQAEIYCLVRANTLDAAQTKLHDRLAACQVWQDSFADRILPVIGDLSQPLLGLTEAQFQTLAAQMDVIYHNGAWVHHTSPYSLLKATNVLGTQEVIRLACCGQTKPLHFISSISVFAANHQSGVRIVQEQDSLDPACVPSGGYAQSKWVAERLVTIAQARGLPVCIYRPGAISGHSQTGVFNPNDFLYKLIQGCIQLGSAPAGEMELNLLPVDYVSRVIVHLSQQPNLFGKAFHLIHPQSISSEVLFNFLRSHHYAIQQLPYEQWHNILLDIANHSPDHPLYALVSLFSTSHARSQAENSVSLEFDCHNTTTGLENSAIVCPAIDAALLNVYLSYLIDHQFIAQPLQTQTVSTP